MLSSVQPSLASRMMRLSGAACDDRPDAGDVAVAADLDLEQRPRGVGAGLSRHRLGRSPSDSV